MEAHLDTLLASLGSMHVPDGEGCMGCWRHLSGTQPQPVICRYVNEVRQRGRSLTAAQLRSHVTLHLPEVLELKWVLHESCPELC